MNPHAERLARAERNLAEKQARHAEAQAGVENIRARLATLNAERDLLVSKQREGTATPQDGLQFAALNKDIEDLKAALADAQEAADAVAPTEADIRAVSDAQAMLARHASNVKLEALKGKAEEIDALLVRVIGEIKQTGATVGVRPLYQLWTPSKELAHIIRHELPR